MTNAEMLVKLNAGIDKLANSWLVDAASKRLLLAQRMYWNMNDEAVSRLVTLWKGTEHGKPGTLIVNPGTADPADLHSE